MQESINSEKSQWELGHALSPLKHSHQQRAGSQDNNHVGSNVGYG